MDYFILKKVVFLCIIAFGFSAVSTAQETADTKRAQAKIFGGRSQYRTWSVGFNVGALSPSTILTGKGDYNGPKMNLGYDLSLRKQLGHAFALEAGLLKGKLSAENENLAGLSQNSNQGFSSELGWSASLMGVINVATVDFLKKANQVNFLVKFGYGHAAYAYSYTDEHVQTFDTKGTYGKDGDETYLKKGFLPLGMGAKFKVSDRINFNLGYNMYFLKADDLDGKVTASNNDKWSYLHGGLDFSLGKLAKSNLEWVNPLVLMYDELKDPSLRQELDALKNRLNTLETADLLKDTDGDGVADKLDKCLDTEVGLKVDGSGCPLDSDADGIPDSKDSCPTEKGTAALNGCPDRIAHTRQTVQFDFNSDVLKTTDYEFLDKLSVTLRTETDAQIAINGHSSEEGTAEYNMQLSEDRAKAVKSYLVNSGVSASKITIKGFGETQPVASNATEEGRQQNRRVEIVRR